MDWTLIIAIVLGVLVVIMGVLLYLISSALSGLAPIASVGLGILDAFLNPSKTRK